MVEITLDDLFRNGRPTFSMDKPALVVDVVSYLFGELSMKTMMIRSKKMTDRGRLGEIKMKITSVKSVVPA